LVGPHYTGKDGMHSTNLDVLVEKIQWLARKLLAVQEEASPLA